MRRLALLAATCCIAGSVAALASAAGPIPSPVWGGDGIRSLDGKSRYVTLTTALDSVVAVMNTSDGSVRRWRPLPDFWGLPAVTQSGTAGGLSHDGTRLVLGRQVALTQDQTSGFLVLDTKTLKIVRRINLHGAFAFDALSANMKTLFVIQWISFDNQPRYQVKAVDIPTGKLLPGVIVDRDEKGPMQGYAVKRVTEGDGRWVYTLYGSNAPGEHAFVHALDTVTRTAKCIDLPWPDRKGKLFETTLRLERGGKALVLRDRSGHALATIEDRRLVSAEKSL